MGNSDSMSEEFLWTEKYRPHVVSDCILTPELKKIFTTFVDQKAIPNLILAGSPGLGKTSVAKALCEELQCDYIVINASMNGNIDTLRNDIFNFASSVSMLGGRKYVILDEADYLNPNSTQPALRNFMDEFSSNCGFIFTCNFPNRIIDALHSRCSVIHFVFEKKDQPTLAAAFFKRAMDMLTAENIPFDKAVVAKLIEKHFPDYRRVINELQSYSATGNIDVGVLSSFEEENFATLVSYLKAKEFKKMRMWVGENTDIEFTALARRLYDKLHEHVTVASYAGIILILADYQFKAAFAADKEINTVAALTQIMTEAQWT